MERSVQLDEPWALCVSKDVTLGANVSKLILLVLYDLLANGELVLVHYIRRTISVLTSDLSA